MSVNKGKMVFTPTILAKMLGFPPGSRVVDVKFDGLLEVVAEHESMPGLDENGGVKEAGISFEMRGELVHDKVIYIGFGTLKDSNLEWSLGYSDDFNEKGKQKAA